MTAGALRDLKPMTLADRAIVGYLRTYCEKAGFGPGHEIELEAVQGTQRADTLLTHLGHWEELLQVGRVRVNIRA